MHAYLDTEVTDLAVRPRMLSMALVTEAGDGREFYAEVSDPDRIRATGWFGACAVLPQFGRVADASCPYAELGARLRAFVAELTAGLRAGEFVDIACGHRLDWELFGLAIGELPAAHALPAQPRFRPVVVDELTGYRAEAIAARVRFNDHALGPISRHHALCDARTLRMACEAARCNKAGLPRQSVQQASHAELAATAWA